MAFKLDSIFNSKTLSQANDSYKVQYIERSKIIPNEHNKEIYSTDKTLLLSYGIEDKGLLEPLIVKKDDEGTYTLLSGHRRLAAIEIICKRNPDKASDFEVLPCILRNDDDDEEILIDANFYNREKTDAEKAKELAKKKEKLEQRKANGEKINGQLIKLIAEDMNISVHQAKKLNSINLNATDSVKDAFDAGEITVETAYHLSKADEKTQDDFIQNARDNDKPIATHEVKEAVAAAKPKMYVMPKTPISDNENASKPTVGTMSDNDEYLSSEDDKLKNVLDECQKKFVSDTVIPEASISEVDDLCKEIAKIMRLFASEKEITLNKNEVSEIRNIFEKVLSRLTNQSDTV